MSVAVYDSKSSSFEKVNFWLYWAQQVKAPNDPTYAEISHKWFETDLSNEAAIRYLRDFVRARMPTGQYRGLTKTMQKSSKN